MQLPFRERTRSGSPSQTHCQTLRLIDSTRVKKSLLLRVSKESQLILVAGLVVCDLLTSMLSHESQELTESDVAGFVVVHGVEHRPPSGRISTCWCKAEMPRGCSGDLNETIELLVRYLPFAFDVRLHEQSEQVVVQSGGCNRVWFVDCLINVRDILILGEVFDMTGCHPT